MTDNQSRRLHFYSDLKHGWETALPYDKLVTATRSRRSLVMVWMRSRSYGCGLCLTRRLFYEGKQQLLGQASKMAVSSSSILCK